MRAAVLAAACLLAGAAYGTDAGSGVGVSAPAPASVLVAAPAASDGPRFGEPALGASPLQLRLGRLAASWRGGPVTASTGETVTVYISNRYTPEQHTPEGWAEMLVSSPHGPELGLLTAYVAPLDEVAEMCGPQALGCYGGQELISIGDAYETVTPQEVVRHELGHHIAFNRLNTPWRAVDWGPKAWATDQDVCARAATGQVYPGDEGDRYVLNPGEGWAEAYRVFAEQRAGLAPAPWQIVDPSFQPDAEALLAIERDVAQPWTAPTTATYAKKLTKLGRKVWSIPITGPLDGDLAVTISLPKGGYHDVVLLGPDGVTVLARGLWAGTTVQRITTTVCGKRPLTLRITRRGSVGRVAVVVSTP